VLRLIPDAAEAGSAAPATEVNTWADEAGRVFARAFAAGRERWIDWHGLGRFTFAPGTTEVRIRPEASTSSAVLHATFDRVIQPVILQALGWQALHASGVAGPDGALLFCGLGRSGKSTLSYATGRRSGFTQIADDAVVIEDQAGRPYVRPLPFAAALRQDAAAFLKPVGSPRPSGPPGPSGPPSVPGSPQGSSGYRLIGLRMIFALSQNSGAPAHGVLSRVAPADAFPLLLTHAHCFDEGDEGAMRRMVEAYLAMAAAIPVFTLAYRPEFASLERLVDTVIAASRDLQA